jgi:aerobic C4-dicarboxylate transport protein
MQSAPRPNRWYRILYVQVLIAVLLGVIVGCFWPDFGKSLKPLGDAFYQAGKDDHRADHLLHRGAWHCSMSDLKKLGRIGGKSLLYFEVISTLALVIGLVVVNVLKPGAGFHGGPVHFGPESCHGSAAKAHSQSLADFLLNIIPSSFLEAFVRGELLPVLFVALLTSFAISALGSRSGPVLHAIDTVGQLFFGIMSIIIKVAPIGSIWRDGIYDRQLRSRRPQ